MSLTAEQLAQALEAADTGLDGSLERLYALLRIPSVSTDPAYKADCARAADWLKDELTGLGFDASVRSTPGQPMVVGHQRDESGPNVLFYGHYDVQPVDPLNLWTTPPFEPQLIDTPRGKAIAARGASDDKGLLMTFVEACRAIKSVTGELPLGVSVLLEGEEESGSPSLAGFLDEAGPELKSDIALVCDTGMWDFETPAITTMLRGLVAEEMTITCANRDLHSGGYGSAARNPNQVIAELIASLRAPDGSVTIEGFYDDVEELPEDVARKWEADFDGKGYLAEIGLTAPAGEQGRSVLEQTVSRPTCEINGISGGYTGDGFKTVIPSVAKAKISFRLVASQDPEKIRNAFYAHIRERLPSDCQVDFHSHGVSAAISVPADGDHLQKAKAALGDEWNKEPVIAGSGGSIPVVGSFKRDLGMDSLLIGFSMDDNNVHSPNEKLDLISFHKGIRSWIRVLAALAE